MKKLLILTTFGFLTAALGGCHMCERLWRGSAVTAQPGMCCEQPCAPVGACESCSSCGSGGGAMMVSPGPGAFPGPN
jgi:hypothetical protein